MRKSFLDNKVVPVLILACSVLLMSCERPQKREVVVLSGQWNFVADSASLADSGNWAEKGLPPELARPVNVPHTWNAEKALARYTGKAWYERKFAVSEEQLAKTIRLQFDAVYHDAFVYVNGRKAGEHLGSGYNRFFVDATPFLKAGDNTLTVCADNSYSRSNIPFMRSYDWANDGGIIRNVYAVITEKQAIRNVHVAALPEDGKGLAKVKVHFVDSEIIDPARLKLEARVTEENQPTQSVIFEGQLTGKLENGIFVSDLSFEKINLWHFDSPNLYKLDVKLLVDGTEKDAWSTVFGFRTIKIENNRYVLNGEPMRLMGVEWMPGSTLERGMAETTADLEGNLKLMKNVNCIFTRFHWQQDEYVFDWCDRNGILVQEEIPYWGIWTILNDTLLPKGFQHLEEMTDAHFNHPSIISWGIGNELFAHDSLNKAGLKQLYERAKEIDPSRLSTYVTNALHFDMPSENKLGDASYDFDMIMFNEYYSTWYKKSIDVISGELDRMVGEYPNKPMTISEWGICDPPQKEEGDARRVHEMAQQIEIYGSKPYMAGAIYFCLNDYRTQRSDNYSAGYPIRDHGVCDGYHNPKKSYATLKSISSPVEIKNVVQKDGEIFVTLYGRTGIPSYTLRNYTIQSGNEKVLIDELKPGEEKTFEIKSGNKEFGIFRPTGFEVIHQNL
jgi:beta-glucuronidase